MDYQYRSTVAWLEEELDISSPGAFSILDLQVFQSRLVPVIAVGRDLVVLARLRAALCHLQRAIDRFDCRVRRYQAIEAARSCLEQALIVWGDDDIFICEESGGK